MDDMKLIIHRNLDGVLNETTLKIIQIGDTYYVPTYGKAKSIEAMVVKAINRYANSAFMVTIRIGKFDLMLTYTSTPETKLCGYLFTLRHDGVILSTVTESQVHYRAAIRTIQKQTSVWLKWARFTFDTKSHIFQTYGLVWADVTDLASWKAWVWDSLSRGGVAHIKSLDDAWERQEATLIPLIENVISEVKHELAKTA